MKTIVGLLIVSFSILFIVNNANACPGLEWIPRTHDHDPQANGHGGGEHTHNRWASKCPDVRDGPGHISSIYTDAHDWGAHLSEALEDHGVETIDPDDTRFPATERPQTEVTEPLTPPTPQQGEQQGGRQTQDVQQPVIVPAQDTVNNGGGESDTQGLPPLPDVTTQNPTQNPTQDAEQPTSQAIQGQPQQTGVTPQQTGVTPQPTPQATQPQGRQQTPVAQQPLRVTEYMVRDWSRSAGGDLPQWIELYNPNANPILLHNCVFSYVVHQGFNKTVKHVIVNDFTVPAEKAVIFVTRAVGPNRFGGITAAQVYALNIPNSLKSGWLLRTATGGVIFKAGEEFGGTRPHAPNHVDGNRQSFTRYAEADTETAYYYGSAWDIGTPGYHEPVRAAPSVLRKKIGLWGALKQ